MRRQLTFLERRDFIRRDWLEAMRSWAIEWRKCHRDGDRRAAKDALNHAMKARRMAREVYA